MLLSICRPFRDIGRPAFLTGAEGELIADTGNRMAIDSAKSFAVAAPFTDAREIDQFRRCDKSHLRNGRSKRSRDLE